jgi:hypothetical protein
MRIVRDYFGVDRTTVTYENDVSGVGGNMHEFFVLAEGGTRKGSPAVRTTVHFTHEEMAQILADYRQHHAIEGEVIRCTRLLALATGQRRGRSRRLIAKLIGAWRR